MTNDQTKTESGRPDFIATFMESIRKGIESLSILPNDLTGKINEAMTELEEKFESRMKGNRAGLFSWTGIPSPEKMKDLKTTLERLEARLNAIESNIKALENHKEGEPWPKNRS